MKSITEHQVDWSILSNTLELALPLQVEDYPVVIRIFDAADTMVLEANFKEPPVIFRSHFSTGKHRYEVLKNGQCVLSDFLII